MDIFNIVFEVLEFVASELKGTNGYDVLEVVVLIACTAFVGSLE